MACIWGLKVWSFIGMDYFNLIIVRVCTGNDAKMGLCLKQLLCFILRSLIVAEAWCIAARINNISIDIMLSCTWLHPILSNVNCHLCHRLIFDAGWSSSPFIIIAMVMVMRWVYFMLLSNSSTISSRGYLVSIKWHLCCRRAPNWRIDRRWDHCPSAWDIVKKEHHLYQ